MPPASTGRAPRGRGRGRGGRGRGASSAASGLDVATPAESTPAAAVAENVDLTTQSTPQPSAPAPTGPPSVTVPPAPMAPPPSTTTQPAASAPKPAGSKFKPKAIRRSEAERARIAEEQRKILNEKFAEEANYRPRLDRGRGSRRARGRGGFLTRGAGRLAAGPLSMGMSFGASSGSGYQSASGGYAPASTPGSGSYNNSRGASGEGDEAGYGASSGNNDGRINADALYGFIDPNEEEKGPFISTKKKKLMLPMGILRVEHKEEVVTMTTAAEIEAQDHGIEQRDEDSESDGMFVDGEDEVKTPAGAEGAAADDGVWEHAVPKSRGKVRIKDEPIDGDTMDLDSIPGGHQFKSPDSPELKKKDLVGQDEKKKKRKPVTKDYEDEITAENLERMLRMFTLGDQEGHTNELEGHMFTFQLPRVLPVLKPVENAPGAVKNEPTDDDDDMFVSSVPKAKTTPNIDLTNEPDSNIKSEEDPEDQEDESGKKEEKQEGGFIGHLTVRKSGKVQLSWGGITLNMEPGIQSHYFQQAMILEEAEVKPGQGDEPGVAYGMGRVEGGFTLAPDWQDEEEWIVDPELLVVRE